MSFRVIYYFFSIWFLLLINTGSGLLLDIFFINIGSMIGRTSSKGKQAKNMGISCWNKYRYCKAGISGYLKDKQYKVGDLGNVGGYDESKYLDDDNVANNIGQISNTEWHNLDIDISDNDTSLNNHIFQV